MINKFKKSFVLRTDVGPLNAPKPIYFQAFINTRRVRISTQLAVREENWDPEDQRCFRAQRGELTKEDVDDKNLLLVQMLNRADKIYIDHEVSGKYLSADEFKSLMSSGPDHSDFMQFMEKQLKIKIPTWASSTVKHNRRTLALMKEFKKKLPMSEISGDTVTAFEGFLMKKNLAPNTRGKHHRSVKMFMLQAVKKYKIDNPYEDFRLPKAETERVFLINSEVQDLMAL